MVLYRNAKVKVRSSDGDTDYFNILSGVLQGDTRAPYLFIICLHYVFRKSIDKIKENCFKLTKKETEYTPQKQLPTPTTLMIYRFWQMHPPKPKPCYIVWKEPMQVSASISMHTRRNICALIQQATSLF